MRNFSVAGRGGFATTVSAADELGAAIAAWPNLMDTLRVEDQNVAEPNGTKIVIADGNVVGTVRLVDNERLSVTLTTDEVYVLLDSLVALAEQIRDGREPWARYDGEDGALADESDTLAERDAYIAVGFSARVALEGAIGSTQTLAAYRSQMEPPQ